MVFLYHTGDTSAVPHESVWAFSSLWYFLWYYTVPYKYHSTAVWSLCGITFLCGISYGIFRTTWVPQATPLQYHMNMCGTSSSLWYFLWYYIVP